MRRAGRRRPALLRDEREWWRAWGKGSGHLTRQGQVGEYALHPWIVDDRDQAEVTAALRAPAVSAAAAPRTTPAPATAAATSGRCQATTQKGTRCSTNAQAGRAHCWQH